MKKTTIIIKKEILETNGGEIVSRSLDQDITVEEVMPEYVVPTSNFGVHPEDNSAMLIGIPCRVISKEPYHKLWKSYKPGNGWEDRLTIDVKSCVTGITYAIPYKCGWYKEFTSLAKANLAAEIIGHHFPALVDVIDRPYWPRHNSNQASIDTPMEYGNYSLMHKRCMIVSFPYRSDYPSYDGKKNYQGWFVNVLAPNKKIYKVPFEEWAMVEPNWEEIDFLKTLKF